MAKRALRLLIYPLEINCSAVTSGGKTIHDRAPSSRYVGVDSGGLAEVREPVGDEPAAVGELIVAVVDDAAKPFQSRRGLPGRVGGARVLGDGVRGLRFAGRECEPPADKAVQRLRSQPIDSGTA